MRGVERSPLDQPSVVPVPATFGIRTGEYPQLPNGWLPLSAGYRKISFVDPVSAHNSHGELAMMKKAPKKLLLSVDPEICRTSLVYELCPKVHSTLFREHCNAHVRFHSLERLFV